MDKLVEDRLTELTNRSESFELAQVSPWTAKLQREVQSDRSSKSSDAKARENTVPLGKDIARADANPNLRSIVVVSVNDHKTYVLQNQNDQIKIVFEGPNATPRAGMKVIYGRHEITQKMQNPDWNPREGPRVAGLLRDGRANPSNPLGEWALRLNGSAYMLHGTNRLDQIGTNASAGCFRHPNDVIARIYSLVKEHDHVYVVPSLNQAKISKSDFVIKNKR